MNEAQSHLVFAAIVAVMVAHSFHLQRKRQRGESVSYDGDERPVTETDVLVVRLFIGMVVGVYLVGQCLGE